jgi:hypothetical protein
MNASKLSIPLALMGALLGSAVTVGVTKGQVDANSAAVKELQAHDRETFGDLHDLKQQVREIAKGIERLENRLGTK